MRKASRSITATRKSRTRPLPDSDLDSLIGSVRINGTVEDLEADIRKLRRSWRPRKSTLAFLDR
jgi:hypothetical protein